MKEREGKKKRKGRQKGIGRQKGKRRKKGMGRNARTSGCPLFGLLIALKVGLLVTKCARKGGGEIVSYKL